MPVVWRVSVTNRSRVRISAGYHCVVTLVELFSSTCLCHKAAYIIWYWPMGWKVSRHTTRCTSPVSVVSQCKLVSGWGLLKQRSAPPSGPRGFDRTWLLYYCDRWSRSVEYQSVCLLRACNCAVRKRLKELRSCSGWRTLRTQGILY